MSEEPESTIPGCPAALSGLTSRARRDLKERRDRLLTERKIRFTRLKRIRKAYAIEASTTIKFQLEVQIQEDETALARLDAEIKEIECLLQ